MFSPSSPVTGAAITGFTSPTYTLTADLAPGNNGKQFAVTALGGTQANVTTHSVSDPFTVTMFRPQILRSLPAANPVTGVVKEYPVNTYKVISRKGAIANTNGQPQICVITTKIDVVAGVDSLNPAEVKALLSCHIGVLSQQSSGIADTITTGLL